MGSSRYKGSPSLTKELSPGFEAIAFKALQQNGVANNLKYLKANHRGTGVQKRFSRFEKQVKQIKKDVPDEGAWMLLRFDEENPITPA